MKRLSMTEQIDSLGGVGNPTHEEWFVKVDDQRKWFRHERQAWGKTPSITGRRHRTHGKIPKYQDFE